MTQVQPEGGERVIVSWGLLVCALFYISQAAFAQTVPLSLLTQDLRVSYSLPDGDDGSSAWNPAAAYNSHTGKILVVFNAVDALGRREIWGQLTDPGTFAAAGEAFQISAQNVGGNFAATRPSVTYNPVRQEFLVVWEGFRAGGGFNTAIYGRILNDSGVPQGAVILVSDDIPTTINSWVAKVACNTSAGDYLIVWSARTYNGADDAMWEIWARRASSNGSGVTFPASSFRVSYMDQAATGQYYGGLPNVTFNELHTEYLIAWSGRGEGLAAGKNELYYRMVDADGTLPDPMVQLTNTGDALVPSYSSSGPVLAVNTQADEYLVVWTAASPELTPGESEIYAVRLHGVTRAPLGGVQRLTNTPGNLNFAPSDPAIAYDAVANRYFLAFGGDRDAAPYVDDEYEIRGITFDSALGAIDASTRVLSDVGPAGNANYGAWGPVVVYANQRQSFYVFFASDNDIGSLIDDEAEIWQSVIGESANVSVGVSDGADSVVSGGALTYTVSLSNAGPHTVRNLIITSALPAGLSSTNASGSGWNCTASTADSISCSLSALAASASSSLTIQAAVAASAGGTLSLPVTLTSTTYGASGSASDTTNVTQPPPTPTVAATPTATPNARCSIAVATNCKRTVRKNAQCAFTTTVKVDGRSKALSYQLEQRRVGNAAFRVVKRGRTSAKGKHTAMIKVSKTASYRSAFLVPACTSKVVRVTVR